MYNTHTHTQSTPTLTPTHPPTQLGNPAGGVPRLSRALTYITHSIECVLYKPAGGVPRLVKRAAILTATALPRLHNEYTYVVG